MKNIDEAIKHAEEKAKELYCKADEDFFFDGDWGKKCHCTECAKDHEQLANWLKELKRLKERICENCKNYDIHTSDEMPCCKCSQLFNDYFEAKEERS